MPVADRSESTELDEQLASDPDVTLGISGRSGPISIELQYRIPEEKARDFYNVMRQQQQVRSRNGANGWSISRDIADPERWLEGFSCPTWHDYLRLRGGEQSKKVTYTVKPSECISVLNPLKCHAG